MPSKNCTGDYNCSNQCTNVSGCSVHFEQDDVMIKRCEKENGCNFPDSNIKFSLQEFKNGKYLSVDTSGTWTYKDNIAFGSQDLNVPLHFSNFGYWNIKSHDTENNNLGTTQHWAFFAGAPDKEVDVTSQIINNKITESQTYTGKAYVGLSSPNGWATRDENKDIGYGFIASGTAKLTLRPSDTSSNTSLNMNFSDAGWYNVYMNGDGTGLHFEGKTIDDTRLQIAKMPLKTDDIEIHYYGSNPSDIPTEVVGAAHIDEVLMQDGLNRQISFSFGAVKDK